MSIIKFISGSSDNSYTTKWSGEWASGTSYKKNNQVTHDSDLFICNLSHVSDNSTEPGVGNNWATRWTKQTDTLSSSEKNTFLNHIISTDVHHEIDDASIANNKLWSAYKSNSAIGSAEAGVFDYETAVLDILGTPPAEPTSGNRYLVGVGTGDWATHDNEIAEFSTVWSFTEPTAGTVCYVTDENLLYLYNGTSWLPIQNFSLSDTEPASVDYDAGATGISTQVAREDHTHDLAEHSHHVSDVDMEAGGNATYSLEDFIHLQSAGRISGGVITESETDGIDISEWKGLLKTTESDVTHIKYVIIPATNIPLNNLTDNSLNYIIADYNTGSPRIISTTNRAAISTNTQCILGRVYSENGELEIYVGGMNLYNQARINHDRLVARGFERMSGADIYEVGERYIGLTSGIYYFGMNKIVISPINTLTTGTYTRYIRDPNSPNGWARTEGLKQSTNMLYDDGSGTPAEIPDGYYAVRWVYICLGGEIYLLDGQNYFTLAEAKVIQQPTNRPDYIIKNAKLAAKLIVEKGASHFTLVISGYESALFGTIGPSSHEGLANLYGGESNTHYHLTTSQHTALTTNLSSTITTITNPLYSIITHNHDSSYSALSHNHDSSYSSVNHNHSSVYSALLHTHEKNEITDFGNYALSTHYHSSDYSALSHNHDSTYSALSHNHNSSYSLLNHNHNSNYSALNHDHDSTYSVLNHTHTGIYSEVGHNHDSTYSALNHNHSGIYSLISHTHTGVYSEVGHNHDSTYSALNHNHDSTYSALNHNHDSTYSALNHNHDSSNLTDYVAPTEWVPTLVWSTPAPADLVGVYRYTKIGKLVTFWIQLSGNDGDAAALTSISLPITPANIGMKIMCKSDQLVFTTRSDPRAYIVADNANAANRVIQFYSISAFSNTRVYSLNITGQYEVA